MCNILYLATGLVNITAVMRPKLLTVSYYIHDNIYLLTSAPGSIKLGNYYPLPASQGKRMLIPDPTGGT